MSVINRRGFTLIELLLVLTMIGILAAVTLALIDPRQRMAQSRDSQRVTDISSIKQAIDSYVTLNHRAPDCDSLGSCPTDFDIDGSDELSTLLSQGEFLKSIPVAPAEPGKPLCNYHAFFYSSAQDYYNLRWCYESWNESDVNNLAENGTRYFCSWDSTEKVAICFAGTDYDIPEP